MGNPLQQSKKTGGWIGWFLLDDVKKTLNFETWWFLKRLKFDKLGNWDFQGKTHKIDHIPILYPWDEKVYLPT